VISPPVSVRSAIAEAVQRLHAAGVDSPHWDAEQLAAHVLGVARTSLPVIPNLDAVQYDVFQALIDRRCAREPLQHIVGSVGFRYVELAVGPGVFVPRPETESVAGAAIDAARRSGSGRPVVVDLCSGSGAIAFSVAHEVPNAEVHAVEVDPGALVWLHRNAAARRRAGDTEVFVHAGDIAHALPDDDGKADVVVSNPPYVADHELDAVDPEVKHDPLRALVAGADGLDVVRTVERVAHRLLKPGGVVVVEHSDRQGESAPAVFADAGWGEVEDHRDLTGRPRWLTARKDP
jgi:release factor glutamine methyltransferase